MTVGNAWSAFIEWLERLIVGGVKLAFWWFTALPADLSEA